jgi:chloramphenicol-sensitive protein RarD
LSASRHTPEQTRGALAATLCYFLWGLVPIYWKQLASIDPLELIAHRHFWSLVLVFALLARQGRTREIAAALDGPRAFAVNILSATMLTLNWLIYVWAVNTGHVIESSLG